MGIERDPVGTREEACPQAQIEPIVNGNVRSVAFAITGNTPYHGVSLEITTSDRKKTRQYLSMSAHAGSIPSKGWMNKDNGEHDKGMELRILSGWEARVYDGVKRTLTMRSIRFVQWW